VSDLPLALYLLSLKTMPYSTLKTLAEIIVTLAGCMATETLFDRMNWPLFNSWALMHGSFVLLLPIIFLPVHLFAKSLENLVINGHAATPSVTCYIFSNWKTFLALILGFIGFIIPTLSFGGLVLGLQIKKQTTTGVDKGLLTASIVVSSLGTAFALYMVLAMVYFILIPRP
jgi:hypothetical protein